MAGSHKVMCPGTKSLLQIDLKISCALKQCGHSSSSASKVYHQHRKEVKGVTFNEGRKIIVRIMLKIEEYCRSKDPADIFCVR